MAVLEIETQVKRIAEEALRASRFLATLPTEKKNTALLRLADLLEARRESLIAENAKDIEAAEASGLAPAMVDRLRIDPKRVAQMAEGVRQVADLPDPVGEEIERIERPNGLDIRKVRVPIGVVGIIYESRPNVTIDCAALCFKSGNASILRGGREAFHSNTALSDCIAEAFRQEGLPDGLVSLIPTTDREALNYLLKLDSHVHCIIPRGGEGLIRFVAEHARMPVIKHYKGVCNAYVDKDAKPGLAREIVANAKCQRPSVCNAIENLVIHGDIARELLPKIAGDLRDKQVELRCDSQSREILQMAGFDGLKDATEEDYHEEYLDKVLAIKVAPSLEEAINFVNTYGSGHSDVIITQNEESAEAFMNGVDSATIYWNASTRFTDGFEFGMGAEIGISTDKLHARGPMGLKELTTYKYKIYGDGQIRA